MSEGQKLDIEKLKERGAEILRLARASGASQAEVSVSSGAGLSVTARMREVETLEYHRDQGLAVTVYFGQRKGSASSSDISDAAIAESVNKACALARYGAEDEFAGLADADRLATDVPDLDLCHPWNVEPADAIALAIECEAAALDLDPRISNSEGASVSTHTSCRVYGNSHGFLEGYRESQHSLSCAVLASENGQMERDFDFAVARDVDDLWSPAAVGSEAARKVLARLNSRKMNTTAVPILFPARLARSLIGHLLGAISGGSIHRKATFLPDALNTTIFNKHVSIEELPHIRKGIGSAPFDSEGVATQDRHLVEAGVLRGYLLGSYYARKLGMQSTGNAGGAHNLIVSSTGESFADLLAQMGTGFLVNELMGQGVNGVTGDYSRGAAGFWVENGEIQYPVNEVTVSGNLRDMFQHIVAIGTDTDMRGSIRAGSALVEGMTVAGS